VANLTIGRYLQEVTGRQFPEQLVRAFILEAYEWQMAVLTGENSLLFWGADQSLVDPNQALATVMVRYGNSMKNITPRVFCVETAGILPDSQGENRVVALRYDLT